MELATGGRLVRPLLYSVIFREISAGLILRRRRFPRQVALRRAGQLAV